MQAEAPPGPTSTPRPQTLNGLAATQGPVPVTYARAGGKKQVEGSSPGWLDALQPLRGSRCARARRATTRSRADVAWSDRSMWTGRRGAAGTERRQQVFRRARANMGTVDMPPHYDAMHTHGRAFHATHEVPGRAR
ncbi:hypothetical protein OAO87_04025 [bacterium]|nr:hypothetical protein [bacterium]